MYYLVSVDRNGMAARLTRSDWRVLRCAEYTLRWCGTDDDLLWNGTEEDGVVRSECEEDEGTDCEDWDSDTDWQR